MDRKAHRTENIDGKEQHRNEHLFWATLLSCDHAHQRLNDAGGSDCVEHRIWTS
jgi:hypothetical protein